MASGNHGNLYGSLNGGPEPAPTSNGSAKLERSAAADGVSGHAGEDSDLPQYLDRQILNKDTDEELVCIYTNPGGTHPKFLVGMLNARAKTGAKDNFECGQKYRNPMHV